MAIKIAENDPSILHSGAGDSKAMAEFGMVVQAVGHGIRVGVVQFVTGAMATGEKPVFEAFT